MRDSRFPYSVMRGHALTLLLVALVGGSALWFHLHADTHMSAGHADTAVALEKARQGLLAYAMLGGSSAGSSPRPGALPCPDRLGNGRIDSFPCLNAIHPGPSQQGRLPWASLQLPQLRDAGGHPLWYVLDPAVRNSPRAEPLNPDVAGSLVIDGVEGYVAVVIAAGDVTAAHGRRNELNADPGDWLSVANADPTDSAYRQCGQDEACGDRVAGLHRDRMFEPVQRRLLALIANRLEAFHRQTATSQGSAHLPWAAPLGGRACEIGRRFGSLPLEDGNCGAGRSLADTSFPEWVDANDWLRFVVYQVDPACTEDRGACGQSNLHLDGKGGHAAILAAAGARLPGQNRSGSPPHDAGDYLDDPANARIDGHYVDHRPTQPMLDNDVFSGLTLQ